jgi:site-specific DNA-methyltransferase (adenine-specific)
VVARKPFKGTVAQNVLAHGTGALNIDGCRVGTEEGDYSHGVSAIKAYDRFYGKAFAASDRKMTSPHQLGRWPANVIHDGSDEVNSGLGEAARFFYCAKASKRDREEGLDSAGSRANHHPTVKPTDLMRYLCRLVTPPGGIVLDPFTGSGSTGKAAVLEGFRFLGVELSEEYAAIARARIAAAQGPGARSQGPDTP